MVERDTIVNIIVELRGKNWVFEKKYDEQILLIGFKQQTISK